MLGVKLFNNNRRLGVVFAKEGENKAATVIQSLCLCECLGKVLLNK